MYTLGVNPTDVFIPSNIEGQGTLLGLGTRAVNQDGKEYILLLSAAAITVQGLLGFWDENFTFTPVTTALAIGGQPQAASRGLPTAAGQRFWAQTYGMGTVRTAGAVVADVRLATTITAGHVDDAVTTGTFTIEGLHLMVAAAGIESANARISYPHLAYIANA